MIYQNKNKTLYKVKIGPYNDRLAAIEAQKKLANDDFANTIIIQQK